MIMSIMSAKIWIRPWGIPWQPWISHDFSTRNEQIQQPWWQKEASHFGDQNENLRGSETKSVALAVEAEFQKRSSPLHWMYMDYMDIYIYMDIYGYVWIYIYIWIYQVELLSMCVPDIPHQY